MTHRRPEITPKSVIGVSAFLLVLLSPWPSPAGETQWTGGLPEGGSVSAMAVDPTAPSTVYADGTPVWRSTDSGASWSPSNVAGAPGRRLIADAGGVLYYVSSSTTPTVFYRSDDGGDSWTEIDPGAGETPQVVAVDPSDTSILYVGTRNAGIFKSTDTGGIWGAVNTGLGDVNGLRIVSILVDPSTSNTVYAASRSDGVFKTIDGGANWAAANTGLDPLPFDPTLLIDPVTPANVYVASRSGVFKSVDSGGTWADASTGLPVDNSLSGFALDPSSPSSLYAGGFGEIYATSNGGTSWAALGTGLPGVTVRAIVVDPTTSMKVYAGTDEGIVASTDGGTSWQDANSGFHNYYAEHLIVDATNADRLLARDNGTGVYESTDAGATWQSLSDGLPFLSLTSLAMAPGSPQTLFTSTFTEIYRSLDGGVSWSPRLADPGQFGIFGPDIANLEVEDSAGTTLLTGNTAFNLKGFPLPPGVLRSTDSGANWAAFYTPDDIADLLFWAPWSISIDPSEADRVFVGSFHSITGGSSLLMRVVRTEDGGASWDEVFFTGGRGLPSVEVDPHDSENVYIGVFGLDREPDEVYKSTDGGDTFVPLGVDLPCVSTLAMHPIRADSVYAGCSSVRTSEDGGTTWSDVPSSGLPSNPLGYVAGALAVAPRKLHLGTYMGVYSRTWEIQIFADGFESGDTSAWSNTVP